MGLYEDIISFLKSHSDEKSKMQWIRTIKVHDNVYGVKLSTLNPMISTWSKSATLRDVDLLWKDGKTESKIVAAKLLSRLGRKEPEKALRMIKSFVRTLKDWATTDTLATQGIKSLLRYKEQEIKQFALRCVHNETMWIRRFGIVVFVNFPKSKEVDVVIKLCRDDDRYYIKKAVEWLRRKQ